MINKLEINPGAAAFMKTIEEKGLKHKFREALEEIQCHPLKAGEIKKGKLSGIFGYDIYHHGVHYEIFYMIREADNAILVLLVGKREHFYNQVKQYIRQQK